jgi:outer membrane lipoprotein
VIVKQNITLIIATLLLTSCAVEPVFDMQDVDSSIAPQNVESNFSSVHGKTTIWGGLILSGKNLVDHTQLEVLAYPIDERGIPNRSGIPQGRFFARQNGYLEISEYNQGRYVTVVGPIEKLQGGKIDETDYQYPVIDVEQIHLWPKRDPNISQTQFRFGIGVSIH